MICGIHSIINKIYSTSFTSYD